MSVITKSSSRRRASDSDSIEQDLQTVEDEEVFRAVVTGNPTKTAWIVTLWSNVWREKTFAEMTERWGVSRDEFNVLACLGQCGPLRAKTICDVTARPKNSISRAVTQLSVKRFISQQTDANDRRNTRLAILPEGKRMLDKLFPIARANQEAMLEILDEKERKTLDRIFDKLTAHRGQWLP
jgi:DNA-binding MarR family transcriptional regulator